jgi:hypothetical protein
MADEFDCRECGEHIIRIIDDPKAPKLCATCVFLPGWFRYPALRAILAPDGLPNLPKNEKDAG